MIIGEDKFKYELVENWAKLPQRMELNQVTGVVVDSHDNVYISNRSKNPVMVFDSDGNFLDTWGERLFKDAHSIFLDAEENVFCVDCLSHVVMKLSPKGRLIFTLGQRDYPSYTGFFGGPFAYVDGQKPIRAGGPFNLPTKAVVNSKGEIFVSDGYGNCRFHKFSKDGELIFSVGEPGSGPGQMILPHGLCVTDGKVYVTDRVNSCVHVYTEEGKFVEDWKDAKNPDDAYRSKDGNLYILENGRITVRKLDGEIIARVGAEESNQPGYLYKHSFCEAHNKDIYVAQLARGLKKLVKIK